MITDNTPQTTTNNIPQNINALSVSRFNEIVRLKLQNLPELRGVWVEGELFNFVRHTSGHIYFSLKDQNSQLRCTFFKGANSNFQNINYKNGSKIYVWGHIDLYHAKGEYQFNVKKILLAGEGALRLQIEELKKKLFLEGLFAKDKKKKLPILPFTLGVATAATGAAVKDIISCACRRYPNINIILSPCQVQGIASVPSIINALELLQNPKLKVDVIIVGRGGGSFEDLLAFNDEKLLRAISNSKIPIVSAVGHEIDSPLSDLVADSFATTPTAAVEKVIPEIENFESNIFENIIRMQVALNSKTKKAKEDLNQIFSERIFIEPAYILQDFWQKYDDAKLLLNRAMQLKYMTSYHLFENKLPFLNISYKNYFESKKQKYEIIFERLLNFSPLSTLKRGYAIIRNNSNKVIRKANEVKLNEKIEVILEKGKLKVEVLEKEN